jgi:colanic acid biosynthesis glycosyl transferase WcaI
MTGICSRNSWDVIFCTNGSFFTGMTSWLLGKAKGIPFIYNVQDLYPEVPMRAGQLRNPQAIAALKAMEKFMYRKAAHITVISSAQRESLIAKGVPEEKISIVPNFVDTEFIRPLPKRNAFAEQHGLSDKFVVAHAGNVGYVYDLDSMLDAARLLTSHKDILFLIVGNGVAKNSLETKARRLKLANVRFVPFQPYDDLPWLRAASDIQVSLYKSGAASESFPSKIYEVMASGRPLLASADAGSEVEHFVQTAQCGLCVRPGHAEDLAEAVLALYRNASLRDTMGGRGRRYAEEHHSKQIVGARYQDLFLKLSPPALTQAQFPQGAPSIFR